MNIVWNREKITRNCRMFRCNCVNTHFEHQMYAGEFQSPVLFLHATSSQFCVPFSMLVFFFSSLWIHRDVPSLPFHFFSWPLSQRSLMCSQPAPDRYSVPVGGRFWFRFVLSLLFLLFHPLNVGFLFSYSTCSFFFLGVISKTCIFSILRPKTMYIQQEWGKNWNPCDGCVAFASGDSS